MFYDRLQTVLAVAGLDPEARFTRLPDGRTHLACKPEHAVDLDTEAIVAAAIHPGVQGDSTTIEGTLAAAARGLDTRRAAPRRSSARPS